MLSVLELFRIGIGPSSSHTVGPMRAAGMFVTRLKQDGVLAQTTAVRAELFGSLGATGHGHGTPKAVLLGLEGEAPDLIDPDTVDGRLARIRDGKRITLLGIHPVAYNDKTDLVFLRRQNLPYHPNGMRLTAYGDGDFELASHVYYSVGGGFVVNEEAAGADRIVEDRTELPYPFHSGRELMELCARHSQPISALVAANEAVWRSDAETRAALLEIWQVMQACVAAGCRHEGILPGGLKVRRRAAALYRQLSETAASGQDHAQQHRSHADPDEDDRHGPELGGRDSEKQERRAP